MKSTEPRRTTINISAPTILRVNRNYGGYYYTNGDSFFNLFSVSGLDFIVFSYEFDRYGPGILGWTESVLATNQNRRIIMMTHYAGSDCGGTSLLPLSPGGPGERLCWTS